MFLAANPCSCAIILECKHKTFRMVKIRFAGRVRKCPVRQAAVAIFDDGGESELYLTTGTEVGQRVQIDGCFEFETTLHEFDPNARHR